MAANAMHPEPDSRGMPALLLAMDTCELISLDRDDIAGDLAARVGDPCIDRIGLLGVVDFWVGDNSLLTSTRNTGASWVLDKATRAAVSGQLAVPDRARDHIAEILDSRSWAPVVHGPCVVTGVDGPDTVALPDAFRAWFDQLVNQLRMEAIAARLVAMTQSLGIDADIYLADGPA